MTSTAATWAPIIFSGLASGTVAAVVTTFGGQARARRKARARILRCLRQLEVARRAAFEHFEDGGFSLDTELIADLEARCMLAGVPRFAVRTYRLAYESACMASSSTAEETWVEGDRRCSPLLAHSWTRPRGMSPPQSGIRGWRG